MVFFAKIPCQKYHQNASIANETTTQQTKDAHQGSIWSIEKPENARNKSASSPKTSFPFQQEKGSPSP